ncbi:MAG: hypothetical protein ILO34_01035, partial [Kiritimatiellae bacterium]|nr:hypothetical protein [Kiritimatiellia bacterium]
AALQNTDTVEHGQTQYLQTTQKLGNDIALRVGNDFDAQIANDPAGNLKTKLDTANARVEAAQQNLDAKNIELQGARDTLDQKTQALSSARRAKQTYIRDQMSAGQDADPAELAKHDTRIANARNEMEAAQRDVQLK